MDAKEINQWLQRVQKLHQENKLSAARAICLQILQKYPNNAEAHHALGIISNDLQQPAKAIEYLNKTIILKPHFYQAYHNLGIIYKEAGDIDKAILCYQQALALNPNYYQAIHKLGNAYSDLKQPEQAQACYEKALAIKSDYAEGWQDYGIFFAETNQTGRAKKCFETALTLNPKLATAQLGMGNILAELKQYQNAIQCYENALKIKPDYYEAYAKLQRALTDICDWHDFQQRQKKLLAINQMQIANQKTTATDPFCALACDWKPADLAAIAKSHSKKFTDQASRFQNLNFQFTPKAKTRLKIGYLSSDFNNHPVAYLTNNLYATHNRKKFEVYGFSLGAENNSSYYQHIKSSCDHFVDFHHMDDVTAAKYIYEKNIDILIDLNGYTQGSRMTILALRPAPIQAHYLGFLGTTGANFFDYILADEIVIPPEVANTAYSEKPVYLPYYQITDDQQIISDKPLTRKDYGLPENAFVYCCFNNAYKIQPKIFSIWMDILSKTPNAVLWLFSNSTLTENNLRREAQQRGVNPDRLIFTKYEDRPIYLARYRLADLFLDTLFYNANTTGTDALWAGLPLITHPTKNFAGRGAASSLTALGLSELVMPDLDTYRNTAIHFYEHPETLQKIRKQLQKNIHTQPLFDTKRFVKNLEKAYWQMWEIFQKGETPRAIKIDQSN